jgi:glycosyltransferase involved in cell wall biosynthesis
MLKNNPGFPDLKSPKLSIGLGAYNDARFLRGSLDALLAQTFTDFELIISDNASTDETATIIKEYSEKDSRIRLFRQSQNIGLVRNFNFLNKQARGEYFMWTACDDRLNPLFIQSILTEMEKDRSILLGFAPYRFIDETGKLFGEIQKFDLSGNTPISRLLRLFYFNDDCSLYGIFRQEVIKNLEYQTWWGKNSESPLDSGFPFLAYVLSKGNFFLSGDQPLLFKCIKRDIHFKPFEIERKAFQYFFYFLLRKINVAAMEFINIRRGSKSTFLAIILVPVLLIRIILDTIILISHIIKKNLRKKLASSKL